LKEGDFVVEPIIIRISVQTVGNLLKNGRTRFRKRDYTFNYIEINEDEIPLESEISLSQDGETLFVKRHSMQCLFDTGDVTCLLGKRMCRFELNG
jgi:hypothetical protein